MRNALSRLWWGAELVRNGPSYENVSYVFRRTRTAQWVLELDYSRYRPAPIAFVRVAEGIRDDEQPLSDDRMRALSKRVNALLTLHALEAMGLHEMEEDIDLDWYRHRPELSEITSEALPTGPQDGFVSEDAIAPLEEWFRTLAGVSLEHSP